MNEVELKQRRDALLIRRGFNENNKSIYRALSKRIKAGKLSAVHSK